MNPTPTPQQVLGLGQTVPITLLLFLDLGLVRRYLLEESTKRAVPAYVLKIVILGTFVDCLPTHTIANQWIRTVGLGTVE